MSERAIPIFVPLWRALIAVVVAPILPAVLFSLWGSTLQNFGNVLILTLVVSEMCALAFGLPAIMALRNKITPRMIWAILIGGAAAAVPWIVLGIFPAATEASVGNCVTVRDSMITGCGLLNLLELSGALFALGALGGLVFWLIAVFPCRFDQG